IVERDRLNRQQANIPAVIVASNGLLIDGQPTEQAPFLWCDDCARGTELPLTGSEPRAAGCGCNHDWTHAEGNRFARKHHQVHEQKVADAGFASGRERWRGRHRSEEHTSELQSLMRISYAVFCLKKKN